MARSSRLGRDPRRENGRIRGRGRAPVIHQILARCWIMRPKRNPGSGGALVFLRSGIVGEEPRYRWRRTLPPSTPIRQVVLVHIDRRWLPHLVQANGFVRVVAGDK